MPTKCNRDLNFLITRLYYLGLIKMVKFAIRLTKYDARSYQSTISLRGSRWAVLGLCVMALRVCEHLLHHAYVTMIKIIVRNTAGILDG